MFLKMFKIKEEEFNNYGESELVEALELASETKIVSMQDHEAIKKLIRLDTLLAEDIMTDITEATKIDINAGKEEIRKIIVESRYSRIPVYETDVRNIVGILNTKRVLENILTKENSSLKSLVKPCLMVTGGRRLDLLFEDMKKQKEHMAVVAKEQNIAIGIVTMEDILEEVMGEIEDDFEKHE